MIALLLVGCSGEPQVRLVAHFEGPEIAQARFELQDAWVQPAGHEVTVDHQVTDEWVALPLSLSELPVPGEGTVARGPVPAGAYDRVFLRGRTRIEGSEVLDVIEPVAAPFEASPGEQVVVDLDLGLRERTGEEGYMLATRQAVVR